MRYQMGGTAWTGWLPLAAQVAMTVPLANVDLVTVHFRDGADNLSRLFAAGVYVDPGAPVAYRVYLPVVLR